jgi:two-component system, chemotaxis family, protein-glutamate methylesterase/glutaminase
LTSTGRRPHDIVTIGASAGGVEALIALFEKLPSDLPATIAVVIHRPAYHASILAEVLDRRASLRVTEPTDGEPVQPTRIYLAPRDHHLVFEDSQFRLNRGPHQHRTRPAVDPLFLSAARIFGPRVIGVLLSGGGADGVLGLIGIKSAGGISLVQDPKEARNPSMPETAIADDNVDAVLPLAQIAAALISLTAGGGLEGIKP